MSNKHIEELLQHCLAAFDAGLSPEECLSAFPENRSELEPLFRQALSLRLAFAASPRAEFRERTRERILFAAGRDVIAAFDAKPDPEFIKDARRRFIRAAGADAQEALRAVPPPRLPFWMNARRRLLERASAANAPRPAARPFGVAALNLRAGLSMVVIVLAMAVAGLAYTIGMNETPTTSAQLARLEQELLQLQRDQQAGIQINPARLDSITAQVTQIIEQPQQAPAVYEKLPDLISRQRQVINAAANEGLLAPEFALAQEQQLTAAAEKAELRLAASRADEPTATVAASTSTPRPGTATPPPTSGTAAVTATPTPVVTPPAPGAALAAGQIRVTLDDDTTGGKAWKTIELANMSFNIPDSWDIGGGIVLDGGEYGFGVLDVSVLTITTPDGSTIRVSVDSGRIDVITAGASTSFALRTGGVNGTWLGNEELVARAGALAADLLRLRVTFEPAGALAAQPTATPTQPPATSTPSSTATPSATSTPSPVATP